ncbi:enoyl-CoA hydratase/isomerase family protein [Paeniglutamicibacter psychrophenolicus]
MTYSEPAGPIRIERRPGVARIVFQRPAQGNALDLAMAREILAALRAAEADPTVHVLGLTGVGRFFCAGGDIHGIAEQLPANRPRYLRELATAAHDLALAIVRSRLIAVAGVNGAAAGAGLGLLLVSDWVLVSENARLVAAYSTIGLTPDTGVSFLLPRAVGHQRAVDLTLNGRRLTGVEAVEWGLANQSVPAADFAERLAQVEDGFLQGAVHALGPTKRLLRAPVIQDLETHLLAETHSIAELSANPDSVDLLDRYANG